ncbi:MAG: tRNA (N(6)-L-threonylcarbamoyladenosine(37)-C(2))-methylthiotransferase MtaB [Clostridia bacterium]|nr:tRNA (N(6)-L-threonylcarbamoyladenosine(37)-C(2))-methylthiotransferase MtaB [Clostridia bacterium]
MEHQKKIAFLTLGCKTNQYETNGMMQKFIEAGYKICDLNDNPDIYVVNTCTVTNIADRKSRQSLRRIKKKNNTIIVAVGCYAQIAKKELQKMPEIDIVLGNKEKKDIVEYVENFWAKRVDGESVPISTLVEVSDISKQKEYDEYGCVTYTERSRTEIKIQDGCNNFCTYCAIPFARGRIRSRKKENVIKEVEALAKKGIKEIVLTGIHVASYGKDFKEEYMLIDLLEDLNKIDGIERIRLGSLEPTIITDEFVKRLLELEKVCNHFHLSLQSGCDETLKRMNRKYTTEEFKQVTERLRKYIKDVNLTTDIIVGFPGETEEEFNITYKFLQNIAFYKMHVFKYSKRDGTVAAKMPNQIDGNIAEERSKKLIELSEKNMKMYNEKYISKEAQVLFEEKQGEFWIGHTRNYMVVKVKTDDVLENVEKNVEIIEIDGENMIGSIVI